MDCLFCGSRLRELTFFENDCFYVVPDEFPLVNGHVMVVIKRHIGELWELSSDEEESLGKAIAECSRKLKKLLDVDGLTLYQKSIATNLIYKHLHFHLIPRYKNDNLGTPLDSLDKNALPRLKVKKADLKKLSNKLTKL